MRNELLRFLGEHIDELTDEDLDELREVISELVEERRDERKIKAKDEGTSVSHFTVRQDGSVDQHLFTTLPQNVRVNLTSDPATNKPGVTIDLSKYVTNLTWSVL